MRVFIKEFSSLQNNSKNSFFIKNWHEQKNNVYFILLTKRKSEALKKNIQIKCTTEE